MCGIAGHVGRERLDDRRIESTLQRMGHRGPDNATHRRWDLPGGRVVDLLHTRLSIIDLDARSNQPFEDSGLAMAYNGELYNYRELRERLVGDGERFATASDTEVLLRTLARGGWPALDQCEGMWAFAVVDPSSGTVTLSRDRFGEKPLWILRDEEALWFGSEVKFLHALRGRTQPPNRDHLARFIVNGYRSLHKTRETWFEGIEELPPGTNLHLAADGERSERYWDPVARRGPQEDMTFEDAVAGTRERLVRAMELRLRADVPLAFCMSGGIDSTSLIAIARRVFDHHVHGFTILNSDARYEEHDMVEHAISELDLRHTWVRPSTEDFLGRLRGLVRRHDAPVATITYFAHWLLMEAIAGDGYRISVSGSAADELFSGYYDHHLAYLHDVRGDEQGWARSVDRWREHIAPIVRNPFLQDPDYFVRAPASRAHIYLDADEFRHLLRQPFNEPFTEHRYIDGSLLRNRMLNELFAETVPVILREDDLNAMSFSIENRSPFLDRDLHEFALDIPVRHLVQDGRAKAVLRESMRGLVPDVILDNRRKVGFNAPLLDFLDLNDPATRDELLADSPLYDLVDRSRVAGLLDSKWLPNSRSKLLFNVLNAKLFLEEFS